MTIGSRVVFVDETTGKQRYVRIVDPLHADLAQLEISVLAPVGAALLGLPVGGSIDWQFPDGKTRRLRVKELIYQPESGSSYQPGRKIVRGLSSRVRSQFANPVTDQCGRRE